MCDKKNSNDLKGPFEDDKYKSDHHMVNQMSALSSNCHSSSRLGSTSGNSDNSGGGNFRLPGVSSSSSSSNNNNNNNSGSVSTHSTSNCAISTPPPPPPPGHTISHLFNAFVNAFNVQSSELDMIYHAVTSQHNPKSNFSLFGSQIPVSNSYRTIPSNASQIIPSSQQQQQIYASKQSSMPHQPSARRSKTRREANIPRNSQPPKPGLQGPSVSSNAQYPYAFDASLPRNPSHITSGPSFSYAHSMQSQETANTSGSDVPLNLSVKKTSTGESSRDNRSSEKYHKVKGDSSNTGVGERSGLYSHSSKRDSQGNLSPSSEESTLERPRKRGRKPKSLLASQSEAMSSVIMVPELSEMKPKRRGRPPILSPPPSVSPSDKDTQNLNDRIAAEMRRIDQRALMSGTQSWSELSRNPSSSGSERSKNMGNMYHSDGRIVDNLKSPPSFSGESSNNGVIAENSDSDRRNISNDRLRSPISNEEDLRRPLAQGWRRQTMIKCFTRSGVDGEVVYFSPCGRKMRSLSDINKFLSKNNISLMKKENFSFDSRPIIGEFVEHSGTDFLVLSEQEVRSRLEEFSKHGLKRPRSESNRGLNDSDRSVREARHDISDLVGMRNDDFTARTPQDRYARILAEEFIAAREDMIRKYQECKENKRYTGEILKDADPYKQKNYQMIAEVDRERRKQHTALIRAMDAHRRYEEREKERERITTERKLITERRYRKKKLELEIARELRRPVEDMILRRSTSLPVLKRVPGLKLPSKVFAQLLMVHEFLHNFGETLGFDMDSLPSLNTLQKALLNLETEAEDDIISTLHHLLVCAIDDPGTPCHVTTVMGQKLRDAQISNFNLSEILKVYFQSFANQYLDESPEENHPVINIYNALKTGRPFLSLPAPLKMEILAFLCNELSSNQAIVHQIEDTIESLVQLRKERWHLGCELRKYKAIKLRREKSSEEAGEELKKFDKNEIDRGLLEDSAESDVDDNIIITVHETEEDAEITNEELDKKLNKLAKECSQINHKLNKAIQCLRVSPLGLDRYRRRFWFLPAAGCIFIEGIESGQPEEVANNRSSDSSSDEKEEEEEEEEEEENEKDENPEKSPSEQDEETEKKLRTRSSGKDEISIEPVSHERDKKPSKEVTVTIQPVVDRNDLAPAKKEEIKCEMEIEINPAKSAPPLKDSWTSSIKNSDTLNGCASSDAGNDCLNTNGSLPLGDSDIDSKADVKKQWFNMLPRVPCHDSTILMPERKPSSSPSPSSVNDKENSKSEVDSAENKKPDSQAEGVQPNALNAFLYPHLLESFFQQIRPTNGKCSSSDSTSAKSLPSKETSSSFPDEADQSHSKSLPQETELEQQPVVMSNMSRLEAEIALFQSALDSSGMEIDPELKKKLFQHRKMQYRRPKKIPEQFQRGWWRITDLDDVVVLVSTLNEKGIRERQLFKNLNKYVHYVSGRSRSKVADSEFDHNSDDECLSPPPEESETPDDWNQDLALRLDISVLEQIEALEEKIASSSMQIRGWRPLPKITTDNSIRFEVSKSYFSSSKGEKNGEEESESAPPPSTTSVRLSKSEANKKVVDPLKIGRERILTAEAMTERRYLKPPLGFKANTIILPSSNSGNGNDEYADNAADENAPSGLLRWREAVRECESGSQLALLLHFLETCIAWDKSIMRASCQFCSSGENEAQLLLCDGCDKGYHMYCFKPKMETVPEGDWFCFECQNKNTIDKVCIVCGKKGKLINCDTCPKVYHPNCLDPPVTKPPKGRWCCNMCNRRPKKKVSRKGVANQNQSSAEEKETNTGSSSVSKDVEKRAAPKSRQKKQEQPPPPPPLAATEETPVKETKKDKKVKENKDKDSKDNKDNKDTSICSVLLSEIEKHDDSWPFLHPVNTKQFPTYKKIIKKPMDFATIKSRLEADNYKNRTEFIQDCRLIFDNCETFNEDESPVGQAGHNLRRFMDKRWKELGGEKPDKS
ncbi:bromodomain adjacent to zinc finger domain 2B toutatis isoform X2 [Brevipalpus obovatus]|uniref:bromodomain adjacent to zinc finger domain 2B toutatis isoform X2 n=1 Tax=Brevipalpus obovatus TaxID=246614 RepID=UPI003D9E4B4F